MNAQPANHRNEPTQNEHREAIHQQQQIPSSHVATIDITTQVFILWSKIHMKKTLEQSNIQGIIRKRLFGVYKTEIPC